MQVLFVCLGNICRSPAAEGVLRARHPDWTVDSAGTGAWHVGEPPYGPMQRAARARGYDLSQQRARQVQPADFERFDVVLAMDAAILAELRALPGGHRAQLFAAVAGLGTVDVPDPYYTRDFDGCLDMIERGVAGIGPQPVAGS